MAEEKKDGKPAEKPAEQQTPPAEPTPPPTQEEILAEAREFAEANFGSGAGNIFKSEKKPEPAPEKAAEPEKPAAEKPAAAAPAEAATPTPEEKGAGDKKRFVPSKKAPTPEEIEAIARRVAAEEREETPEKPPVTAQEQPISDADLNLTDENRETLDVIAEMEALNPEKYKDLGRRARKFWKAEADRIEAWQREHPGEKFDANAEEHAEFYRRNEPVYSKRDFSLAARSRIEKATAERVEQKIRQEWEPEFKAIKAKELEREAAPKIDKAIADAVETVFKAAPDFEKLIEPGKLTKEAVDQMAEINPVLHEYVQETAEEVMAVVEEVEKLMHLQGHYKFDASKAVQVSSGKVIYPHAEIGRAFQALEAAMAQLPSAERVDNGRMFISGSEYGSRKQEILNSALTAEAKQRKIDQLNSTTWRWHPEDAKNFIIQQSANRVSAKAKKFATYTKAPTPKAEAAAGQNGKPAETEKPSGKAGLAKGTATSSVSDTADNSPKDITTEEKETKEFVGAAFP